MFILIAAPSLTETCRSVPFSPAAKEIQLMHRAPVVGIVVLDGHGAPLPEPLEVAHDLARSPDMQGSHHLLVVSEEQFKVSPWRCSRGQEGSVDGLQVHIHFHAI